MAMPERDDRVERVERVDYPPVRAERATGGIRQLLIMAVVSVASTMVLLMFWAMPQMVTKTDFTKNIQAMSTDVASAKTLAASISAQIAAVSDSVKQVSVEVSAIKNSAYATTSSVNSLIANQINPIQQNLTSLTTAVGRLPTAMPDINPLKTQIADLQKALDAIEVDITALQSPTIPVSSPPTISGFNPTSGTTGTSVVITGTNFNGATVVLFGGSSATYTINSATQITAIMGAGMNGSVSVTTPAGTVTATGVFTNTGTTPIPTSGVTASIIGGSTLVISNNSTSNTVNIGIANGSGKAVYAEQISLTLQFLNSPSAISTWGLALTSGPRTTIGSPSYSVVPGIVSYLVNAGEYITSGSSQTIGIAVATPLLPTYPDSNYPRYFIVTVSITGYSALP